MSETTYGDFRRWLQQGGLLAKFQTQLWHALPRDARASAHQAAKARRSDRSGASRFFEAQLAALLLRVRVGAVDAVRAKLLAAQPTMATACANLVDTVEGAPTLKGSDSFPSPGRTQSAAMSGLGRAILRIRTFVQQTSLAQSRLTDPSDLERLGDELNLIDKELADVKNRLTMLRDRCAGFQFPEDLQCSIAAVRTICRSHSDIADCCEEAAHRFRSPDSQFADTFNRLAKAIDDFGIGAGLSQDAAALREKFEGAMSADAEERLLQSAWARSEQPYAYAQNFGLHVPSCFIQTFSTSSVLNGEAYARWQHWFGLHAEKPHEASEVDGQDVILMLVAVCCTFYRWGRQNNALPDVKLFIDLIFHHRSDDGKRFGEVPSNWGGESGMPGGHVFLRSIYNMTDGVVSGKATMPRMARFLAGTLRKDKLDRLYRISQALLTSMPRVWPVALASKVACFYIPSVRNQSEPVETSKGLIREGMARRMANIATRVRTDAHRLKIQQFAERIYDDASGDELFCSRPGRDCRHGGWLFGQAAESCARQAASHCDANDAIDDAELLFCRPVRIENTAQVWRVWQLLVHLALHLDHFKCALWWPMTLPASDARRDQGIDFYFSAVEGSS